jgi:UDP-N-acetylmuramyl pentapeptide synthase
MLELGEKSMQFHKDIVFKINKTSLDMMIFCGTIYKRVLNQLNLKSHKFFYFSDELKILNFLNKNVLKNDIILVKASNLSRVNKLVKLLLKNKEEK